MDTALGGPSMLIQAFAGALPRSAEGFVTNVIGPSPALSSPRQSNAQFARQSASVPLGHATSPAEVARAVIMILGLPAMIGQTIALDGGLHLQPAPVRDLAGPEE
jgi:hypothetical protein